MPRLSDYDKSLHGKAVQDNMHMSVERQKQGLTMNVGGVDNKFYKQTATNSRPIKTKGGK